MSKNVLLIPFQLATNDRRVFTVPPDFFDLELTLVACRYVASAVSVDGTVMLRKAESGTAMASGTALMSAAFDSSTASADTITDVAVDANDMTRTFRAGDALVADITSLNATAMMMFEFETR